MPQAVVVEVAVAVDALIAPLPDALGFDRKSMTAVATAALAYLSLG